MTSFEWVFDDKEVDEPQLLEADSLSGGSAISLGTLSSQFGFDAQLEEQVSADRDDRRDEGVDESSVDPSTAYRLFAEHPFPNASINCYGEYAFAKASRMVELVNQRKITHVSDGVTRASSESRSDRIARLRAELDDITREVGLSEDSASSESTDASLVELQKLQQALDNISTMWHTDGRGGSTPLTQKRSNFPPRESFAKTRHDNGEDGQKSEGDWLPVVEIYPREATVLRELDKRLSKLERRVLPVHSSCTPGNIPRLMSALQQYCDDPNSTLLDELRSQIDSLKTLFASSKDATHLSDATVLLEKLEDIDKISALLPSLATRLRSIKWCLDDASNTAGLVQHLYASCETLLQTHRENMELVTQVRDGMRANLETVHNNMAIIDDRLNSAVRPEPD